MGESASLIFLCILCLGVGLFIQNGLIRLSLKWGIVSVPSARRRHPKPIPILGGVGIFSTWLVGLALFSALSPEWAAQNAQSLFVVIGCASLMVALGVVDDLKDLSPRTKLAGEFVIASLVLAFEPTIHQLCLDWQGSLGFFVWPLAAVWIVGITNAINLIDGMDMLAGGTALFVSLSMLVLSIWSGTIAWFCTVNVALLVPGILAFLVHNRHPARVFLGDNGSLLLGFSLATSSLMCRPQSKSWIMLASVVFMLGYPLLDTALATLRRFNKKLPIFKADRNHLHYRVLRLGLTVNQTAGLLLSITVYLQISAICMNRLSQAGAVLAITVVTFSIFSLLFLVRSIERWRAQRLYSIATKQGSQIESSFNSKNCRVMHIELEPLLEAGMAEEKLRYQALVSALILMISAYVRDTDLMITSNQRITLILHDFNDSDPVQLTAVRGRFGKLIQDFLALYKLQCSLSGLPIIFDQMTVLLPSKSRAAAVDRSA